MRRDNFLILLIHTFIPLQSTKLLFLSHFLFLFQIPHEKSCGFPKCSSCASHSISSIFRQQIIEKVIRTASSIHGFHVSRTGLMTGLAQCVPSLIFTVVPVCHTLCVFLWCCGDGLWWADISSGI